MRSLSTLLVPLILSCLLWAPAALGATAARLEYRGAALTSRQVESLLAPALRVPRDSAGLAASLGVVIARLQDLGYLDARAEATLDTSMGPRLHVEIQEGPRYRIEKLTLDAPAPGDSTRFADALGLAEHPWVSPKEIGAAIARAVSVVSEQGYPYAQLGVRAFDADSGAVRLRLSGALGPRVTITRARIEGLKVTSAKLAEKSMGRLAGLPYNHAAALQARDRLAQLGLFRSVTYEGIEGEGDWSRAQLVYRVEEPRYNQFEGVVGVQGNAGTVGLARLELGNLLGTGRVLGLSWESRGHGVASFAAHAREPLLLGAPLRLEVTLEQLIQDTLYSRMRWGVHSAYALSGEDRIEAGFEQERVVQEHSEVEEARMQNTMFALERSTLDQPLSPRHGLRTRLSATQVFKRESLRPSGARSARASAVDLRSEWVRPVSASSGLSLELTAAGRFSSERVLPVFERYAVGGAASLRGHNEEEFRVDRYALSRLEWRFFLGNGGQRTFLFWDHAWMGTRIALPSGGDHLEQMHRDGIGFGLRLQAAGGFIGVDYGLAPGRPPLEGKIHLQLISTF